MPHARGFGFVRIEGEDEDIFIPKGATKRAFYRDVVEVRLKGTRPSGKGTRVSGKRYGGGERKREGEIIRIVSRGVTSLVGTYIPSPSGSYGFVRPENRRIARDIFIPLGAAEAAPEVTAGGAAEPAAKKGEQEPVKKRQTAGAGRGGKLKPLRPHANDKVVCTITDYGAPDRKPEGVVTEILGAEGAPGVDILAIARGFELPVEFPEAVVKQAERAAKPVSAADMQGRRDFRELLTVTIDGEDSKDFDDAVSLTEKDGIRELYVHIADVANYVQEGSALDREARKRGNSVYLLNIVLPMLPTVLSNGICSLNENEDRLAVSCHMTYDAEGKQLSHEIVESVIRSDRRMTYTEVARLFDGEDGDMPPRIRDMLLSMRELAKLLRANRKKRGSVDFDLPESKITLDDAGRPSDVRAYEANEATRLIEDFMLAANETVAEHFYWLETPFVYRNHAVPDRDKMTGLAAVLRGFGYTLKKSGDTVHPMELQKLLARLEGKPEEGLLTRLVLRSMNRACYGTVCAGHFGLSCKRYCHFTSPIRRYPDLLNHRVIKDCLRGRLGAEKAERYEKSFAEAAVSSSDTERLADEAEREVMRLKKTEYMASRIGRIYEGVISGVTEYGMYVELPSTVEGMVPVITLAGDYFYYEAESCALVGLHTGARYTLGQRVRVRVHDTDIRAREITFVLA